MTPSPAPIFTRPAAAPSSAPQTLTLLDLATMCPTLRVQAGIALRRTDGSRLLVLVAEDGYEPGDLVRTVA